MVAVKLTEKIIPDGIAAFAFDVQALLDECEVFFIMFLTKGYPQKLFEPFSDVIGEPVSVEEGDDVVLIRKKVDSGQWAVGSYFRLFISPYSKRLTSSESARIFCAVSFVA
jgi:hypothetical protein